MLKRFVFVLSLFVTQIKFWENVFKVVSRNSSFLKALNASQEPKMFKWVNVKWKSVYIVKRFEGVVNQKTCCILELVLFSGVFSCFHLKTKRHNACILMYSFALKPWGAVRDVGDETDL